MASIANNPLSRLLDISFPDIKRSNWNCSHSVCLTASPCFVNPVFVDRILPNTRVKFDMNTASFANATVAPLYGRFKVKYIAFWAPDRLYIQNWLMGDKFDVDDRASIKYPTITLPNDTFQFGIGRTISLETLEQKNVFYSGGSNYYVPPTSLIEMLGLYPAYAQAADWLGFDLQSDAATIIRYDPPTPSNALPFLAFWDCYRHFIMNQQESAFPIRTKSFKNAVVGVIDGQSPSDAMCDRETLDTFFKYIKTEPDVSDSTLKYYWETVLRLPSLFPRKEVLPVNAVSADTDDVRERPSSFIIRDEFNYLKPIAPYNSDPYTSWISNENVELETSKSFVDTSSGGFSMEQWKVASRIQNMYRKSLFKNDDFAEYMSVQYGVRPSTGITKPMFLGAFESDIVFNDVVSTAQTGSGANPEDNDALGSRAGYGRGRNTDKRNFVDFTSKEPGTFLVLQIIMPEVFYFEGRDLMYDKQSYDEEFNPEFDAIGYQDLQKSQMNLCPGLAKDPGSRLAAFAGYNAFNTAIAQQPYAMEHMVKPNLLKGMMVMPNYYQKYTLARSFNYNRGNLTSIESPARGLYSTYPFPEMYNNIFQSQINADNFQFYLQFDYLKYQPISKQFLSF